MMKTTNTMKRYLAILFIGLACITGIAQEQKQRPPQPHMTFEEYQAKQKEFIISQAELTEEESAAFFPLYFELQGKKHEANRRVWKQVRAVSPHERTEEECDTMINALANVKIECATLEKEYLIRFRQILSAKKLMRVQMAEERFQRELLRGMQQGAGKRPKKSQP